MRYLLIFLIIVTSFAQAKTSVETPVKDEIKNFCLKDIQDVLKVAQTTSIETKFYQKIFMDESEAFCACVDKAFIKEPKIFGISLYFLNPERRFTQEDYCRHEHYKEGTFEVSTILAHKKLQEIIQDKIRDRYVRMIWLLASQESIAKKFLCLEEKVQTKCLKTGSGGVSYHCIHNTMTSGVTMNKLDDECPQFETVNYSSPMI